MKIIRVILDGFKSYGQPTPFECFDPRFTVITGRNGSGKSNVLDAILFLLGLHSWRLARAQSALELIYKSGQAGVRVARVTVVFCNRDKAQSPEDLRDLDELVVAREVRPEKTQYYLNGRLETVERMRRLFKSVGLNIDNPTAFFVQQGRVAAIVNFQPLELMGFLEEAAGTAFYNAVKEDCLETIERKQEKVDGVGQMLAEVEALMAQKLSERHNLRQWREAVENARRLQARLQGLFAQAARLEQQSLSARDDSLQASASHLQQLTDQTRARLAEQRAQLGDLLGRKTETEEEEGRTAHEAEKAERREIEEKERQVTSARQTLEFVRTQLREAKEAEAEALAAQRLSAIRCDERNRLRQEAQQTFDRRKVELSRLTTAAEGKAAALQLFYLQSDLQAAQQQLAAAEKEEAEWLQLHAQARDQAKELQTQRHEAQEKLSEVTATLKSLAEQRSLCQQQVAQLEQAARRIGREGAERPKTELLNDFFLQWTPAGEALQSELTGKIKGRLCSLARPKEPRFALALERAAGGKLWYVVVDSDRTAELILSRGCLQRKETLLPLNRIMGAMLTPDKLARAAGIAQRLDGTVWNPLELIEFDAEVQRAVEFGWGDKMIASSQAVAQAVAFAEGMGIAVVTLEGDSVSPAGVFEGGFSGQRRSAFALAQEAKRAEEHMAAQNKAKETADEQRRELSHGRERLEMLLEQVRSATGEKEKFERLLQVEGKELGEKEAAERLALLAKRKQQLKDKIDQCQKIASADFSKQPATASEDSLTAATKELETKAAEAKSADLVCKQLAEDYSYKVTQREKACSEEAEVLNRIKNAEEALDAARRKAKDGEAQRTLQRKTAQEKKSLEASIAKTEEELAQHGKELGECRQLLQARAQRLETLRQWEGTPMPADLSGKSLEEIEELTTAVESELQTATRKCAVLEKHIDKEVEMEVQRIADGFEVNSDRYKTVLRDKHTLTHNIQALDIEKEKTLQHSFEAVNGHFASMATFLLPTLEARLELVDVRGRKGIAIHASISGIEIRDLKCLSGGQRSLLALAYILALLRYKPGPFYILDEVDAALDLAHTERLGEMLSREFSQSQFVVISLREEFLASAKVIFKVSVREGRSQVDRIPAFGNRLTAQDLLLTLPEPVSVKKEDYDVPSPLTSSKAKSKRVKKSKNLKG